MTHRVRHLAPALVFVVSALFTQLGTGCAGPCDKACEVLVQECDSGADSYSAAPGDAAARGCAQVDPGPTLSEAICLEQCQDWQAEGTECLADLSCGADAEANASAVAACLKDKGRADSERESGDDVSDCRKDCDNQASACGGACVSEHGDTPTCAGCFDNCDKARARCRGWCKLIGQ